MDNKLKLPTYDQNTVWLLHKVDALSWFIDQNLTSETKVPLSTIWVANPILNHNKVFLLYSNAIYN